MNISYGLSNEAYDSYFDTLQQLAASEQVTRICEIGGGANPALSPEFVAQHDIDYTVVDISAEELDKAPEIYKKVQADITSPNHGLTGPYDLIFSKCCAEHVPDGEAFHRHVYDLLADGGKAIHLFPTLYSPPFVFNRLVPEFLSSWLLLLLTPHRVPEGDYGKFPVYYRWCRGPVPGQIRKFERLGYEIDQYAAFFGHSGTVAYSMGYLDRLPRLQVIHQSLSRWLVKWPSPWITTYAFVVLAKGMSTRLRPGRRGFTD